MLAAQRTGLAILLVVLDLIAATGSLAGAYLLRFGDFHLLAVPGWQRDDHLVLAVALVLAWISALWLSRLYRLDHLVTRRPLFPRVAILAPATGVAVAAALFLFQAKLASRLVFGYALVGVTIGSYVVRAMALAVRRTALNRSGLGVLIIGTGETAQRLGDYLGKHPELGYRNLGYLARSGEEPRLQTLGSTDDLASLLDRHVVDQVIIAAPLGELGDSEHLIRVCDEVGVDVSVAAGRIGPRIASISIDEVGGTQLLRLASSPQFRAAMAGKRLFDVVAGTALLILSAPLLIVCAIAVKLTSPGPVLFIQRRVGLNGRTFPFLKLRTMTADAESRRPTLRSDVPGPVFKMNHDPRVTAVGRVLRRFSLDELPQLFNVLAGHMSLVGPRPPLPDEVAHYHRWQLRRLSVKPGITCTWQVSGRSDIPFEDWMRLDLAYIDNWSPWLDLKILAQTVPAVLSRRGAR